MVSDRSDYIHTYFFLVTAILLDQAYPRFLIIAIPPLYLLQGAGAAALWRRWRPVALVALLGSPIVVVHWLNIQATDPSFAKDDLRLAAGFVSE